eukprot:m.4902 g.4902  ORF g.4902 m.4902 type:complete len:66 (+) comp2465_c0_seq1:478-675(+)
MKAFSDPLVQSLQRLFPAIESVFQLCQAKCRTHSGSVQHQNKFRDNHGKFCFGQEAAQVVDLGLK